MKTPIGIVLLLLGVWLAYAGFSRRDSLVGHAAEAGANIANAVDGGGHVPRHTGYIIAGVIVAVAGASIAFRRGGHHAG